MFEMARSDIVIFPCMAIIRAPNQHSAKTSVLAGS